MISLFNEIRTYLITQYKITRLDITEKIIIGINLVIQVIIIALLVTVILIVASFALADYLDSYWNNAGLAFLAVSGIDTVLLLIFIIFRKNLILKPLSKILIQLLLNENREEEDDEEDEI